MTELQMWIAGVGAVTGCAIFLKFFPKEKLRSFIVPACGKAGDLVSKLGNSKLGQKAMDALEEGPICTLLYVIIEGITEFGKRLVADNKTRQPNK